MLRHSRRLIHKYIYKMNKAYLRHLQEEQKFELTFQFTSPPDRINRQFNFCRSVSETVSTFLSRVTTNIEKELKKRNKNTTPEPLTISLTSENCQILEEVACKDIFTPGNSVILNIKDQQFSILINSPWITTIALPSSIMAGFFVYPTKFDSIFTNKSLSDFNWYKSKDQKQWQLIGNNFIYEPNNDAIDHYLKLSCVPRSDDNVEGPMVEAVSTVKVQAGPGQCPFEIRKQFTKDKLGGENLRIVTYNILADLYCDSDYTRQVLHPYCPPYALHIDYRKQLIIKELLGYNADIICLQEVDRKLFNYEFRIVFGHLGFDSDLCLKGGEVAEGLACFFNKQRFKQIDRKRFILSEEISTNKLLADIWAKIETNQDLKARISDRSTALQVNVLESLENNEILVVGNTHLYFHPDADHIRLLQGGIIIKYLESLCLELSEQFNDKRVSLILCGDFNSVPDCGIYHLYTTGNVAEDHVDYESNPKEAVKGVKLEHKLRLKSACGTPEFTNFTVGFRDCLDYIFYEPNKFEVTQVVPQPSNEELTEHVALPSVVFPSDHVAQISDLKWISINK